MARNPPLSARMRTNFVAGGCTFRMDVLLGEIGYGSDSSYIGPIKDGRYWRWLAQHGIFSPRSGQGGKDACFGFCTLGKHAGKWLGWTSKAAAAFGIGDPGYNGKPARIRNDREAMEMAKLFAISIS